MVSKGQQKLIKLYQKAYGYAIVWTKNGKSKLIDPSEVEFIEIEKIRPSFPQVKKFK